MHIHRIAKMAAAVLIACHAAFLPAQAQRPRYDKLSPMLRKMVRTDVAQRISGPHKAYAPADRREVCAFVQVAPGGEELLTANGCRILAQEGDICIANIPKASIAGLSLDNRILRIEAS